MGCVALMALTPGCASKASPEECEKACENVARVALGQVESQLEQDEELRDAGESGREIAKSMAEQMMNFIEEECSTQCEIRGTRNQAGCLTKAANMKDLYACE